MTKAEVEENLKRVLKTINSKDKKEFLNQLKQINKEIDKLDKFMKNVLDGIKLVFSFNIDKKILNVIGDIAENIEDDKLDKSIKAEIESLIVSFLSKNDKKTDKIQEKPIDKSKELWEETKKVRKAL